MKKVERRAFHTEWEIRENGDGTAGIRGYAAVFDSPAHGEVVRSTAFTKTLAEQADCRMLVNHEGVPIARTKAGTLTLTVDERGLIAEAPSLDMSNPTVQELISAMRRGDIDQMSFAFAPVRDAYNAETKQRELLEVRLYDVSIVTYPWYEDTTVGLRDLDKALVELRNGKITDEGRSAILRAMGDESTPEAEPMDDEDADAATEAAEPTLADSLRMALANVISFYLRAHGAHWNVVGSDFSEYHALFASIYSDTYDSVDPLAENIRKLGGEAPFQLGDLASLRTISDAQVGPDPRALAQDLLDANAALLECLRGCADEAEEADEQGLLNFLAERIDHHQTWAWQLASSLGQQLPKRESSDAAERRARNLEVARLYLAG